MEIPGNILFRVSVIDNLLQEQRHDDLEKFINQEFDKGLLEDETFSAARMLNFIPTAICLATLGVANLAEPDEWQMWLACYLTLARREETPEFQHLPEHLPVKQVTRQLLLLTSTDAQMQGLAFCTATPAQWVHAFELAFDQDRFEIFEQLTQALTAQDEPVQALLLVLRSFWLRQGKLKRRTDLAPLARSLVAIREKIPAKGTEFLDIRSNIAERATQYFLASNQPESALVTAGQIDAPIKKSYRLLGFAEANCRMGRYWESVEWLDQAMEEVMSPSIFEALHKSYTDKEEGQGTAKKAKFSPEIAGEALSALQRILDRKNQKAFLVSGTLLGYAREGQLLAHDKDVDVGIVNWTGQFDIAATLLESGEFSVATNYLTGADSYYFYIIHRKTHIPIDVFIYHPRDGKFVTGVLNDFGYVQNFAFTPFELKKTSFLGSEFYVPEKYELKLLENYGENWRIPDPDYIPHLESPATLDAGGLIYQIVGRSSMMMAIQKMNANRLLRALEATLRYQGREAGISPALAEEVRRTAAEIERRARLRSAAALAPQAHPSGMAAMEQARA